MNIEFRDLYRKFLEIYWAGDISNALELSDEEREAHQQAIDSDIDQPETIFAFATERSMTFSARVDHFYEHDDGREAYLEKVFIVDEGTNVLRFEFGGRVSYPLGAVVPCEVGRTYSFSGRIASADFFWSYMNPHHMYASYGFRNGVTYLELSVSLEDATCVPAAESTYTGRSFGLAGGERYLKPLASSDERTSSSDKRGSGCFIATAAYRVTYNEEPAVLYDFRDCTLMKSRIGKCCVALYYVVSPPIAGLIARSNWLRSRLLKYVLGPIVLVVSRKVNDARRVGAWRRVESESARSTSRTRPQPLNERGVQSTGHDNVN